MQIKVKIAGNDVTQYLEEKSLKVDSVITDRIDTCGFTLVDTGGSLSIAGKDEIIISNDGETVRYFGGYLASIEPGIEGITGTFICKAQDYSVLLGTVLVNKVFEDKTDKEILQALFTEYLAEITTADYIQDGLTNVHIDFNRTTLAEAVSTLAANSGFDWYVDYDKKLHYFHPTSNLAPFHLSDNPNMSTTFPYAALKYKKDASHIINLVTVEGGTYFSDDMTYVGEANGEATKFLLPYKLHPPVGYDLIRVYENIGSDETPNWDEFTVGIDNVDELGGGIDVLYNFDEKLLIFAAAPSELKKAIQVIGRYDVPVLCRIRSITSYDLYGKWFEEKVANQDIDDKGWAMLVGKGILADSAFVKESGSLYCDIDGLVAGQRVYIANAIRGIEAYYIIHKVTMSILGGTYCRYKVQFGEYNPDLIDLLIAHKLRSAQYQGRRDDEVLLELLEFGESLPLVEVVDLHTDTTPATRWIALPPDQGAGHHVKHQELAFSEDETYWVKLSGQYAWSPHEDNGLKEAVWDFFSWG